MKKDAFYTPNRERYDTADEARNKYRADLGVTEHLVREISRQKNEPEWMLEKRLRAFALYKECPLPSWGPDLSGLELDKITYFVRPDAKESRSWEDVPEDIRTTFNKLGIPEAEQNALGGVGAQYDSDIVYHNLKEEWEREGVIFENMDTAVHKYPEYVKEYFMTRCVPINDHKFVMLHAAVWSGGTFIYVPPGVKVTVPLQAYFRMNAERGGQFEHTLIIADKGSEVSYIEGCSAPRYQTSALHAGCVELFVNEDATIRYSSIENWSRNTYNLNTKRALVERNGRIEWVNGNMGSGITMLYPSSILAGEGAHSESLGIAFAGAGQNQDTGSKVVHVVPNTSSVIRAKSISRKGGTATYRGLVRVGKRATGTKSSVVCDALMIEDESVSHTYPFMKVENKNVSVTHEARAGKIGEEELFYAQSRGLTEEQAIKMIVGGFVSDISKKLPLEYAVEFNRLIDLEMEGVN
ncbi:MAG: Fe-S cluster assembly protein SufB [Candidatus Ryanbacteria bacterium CG10_big_fil_rev_8_21_14_0_10_43_42]|uniref:Fe-S cluster assembly protein SufB n=1 Tax=Candidatus Ryanbacteria bacterium CG10_big_fil_rev_8_21_14_0_10_43_42 TaxID=1974864 RepID=A0A2M8KWL1_9BACT|nr:MAG: Fe-S cluster assembly protein SufB [Candidatus Ryanbacteria bacterium CG10_big_fil_rev_8_21_14_0_10_43_42]